MPIIKSRIEGKPVSVFRNTGCSSVVVRRLLVSDKKLTGQEEYSNCTVIDGTVFPNPIAKIFVKTNYFTWIVIAVCMKNPIYGLIVGNITGAIDLHLAQQVIQVVQTQSQTKNRYPENKSKKQSEIPTPSCPDYHQQKSRPSYQSFHTPTSRFRQSKNCTDSSLSWKPLEYFREAKL